MDPKCHKKFLLSRENPEHDYHTLGWSHQLTNTKLSFDVKSESIYYGKTRTKRDLKWGYCLLNPAIKATVICEPNKPCRVFMLVDLTD